MGQRAHLDSARRFQLSREPGRRLALPLDLAAQGTPLALRLGEGQGQHHREENGEGQ
jgi:hypothetical protein